MSVGSDGVPDGGVAAFEPWTTLTRREVYRNPWIHVEEDTARLPNGHETLYGIVRCAECVGMLPFVDPDTVLLVGQWRYIQHQVSWEMPTGGMHPGETAVDAAQRELAEEAGVMSGRLVPMTQLWTSKSVVDETANLFLALDLEPAAAAADPTELIQLRAMPFDDALAMVLDGEILDAMTMVTILWADRLRRTGQFPT